MMTHDGSTIASYVVQMLYLQPWKALGTKQRRLLN